jgi:hypothetical protein
MKILVLAALSIGLLTTPAHAANLCSPKPGQKWLTMAQIKKKVEAAGYKNFRIGMEYGCYEAEGKKDGTQIEVYVDPITGKVLMVRKDQD